MRSFRRKSLSILLVFRQRFNTTHRSHNGRHSDVRWWPPCATSASRPGGLAKKLPAAAWHELTTTWRSLLYGNDDDGSPELPLIFLAVWIVMQGI